MGDGQGDLAGLGVDLWRAGAKVGDQRGGAAAGGGGWNAPG
jgi:hypothetical protein